MLRQSIGETASLVHGYTMADLHKMSLYHAKRMAFMGGDFSDRYEAAWFAVAELLYSSGREPTREEMHNTAKNGIRLWRAEELRHAGLRGDGEERPAMQKFWGPVIAPRDDFTDQLTEVMALPQVLGQLTDLQYEAIAALAVHGSQRAAAEALGVNPQTFQDRVGKARKKVTELWFAPEHPRTLAPRINPDTCRQGHSRVEYGLKTTAGKWRCRLCARNVVRRRRARTKAAA